MRQAASGPDVSADCGRIGPLLDGAGCGANAPRGACVADAHRDGRRADDADDGQPFGRQSPGLHSSQRPLGDDGRGGDDERRQRRRDDVRLQSGAFATHTLGAGCWLRQIGSSSGWLCAGASAFAARAVGADEDDAGGCGCGCDDDDDACVAAGPWWRRVCLHRGWPL